MMDKSTDQNRLKMSSLGILFQISSETSAGWSRHIRCSLEESVSNYCGDGINELSYILNLLSVMNKFGILDKIRLPY